MSLIREQRGVRVQILFTKSRREVSVEFGMKGLALALRGEGGGCGLRVGIAGELCGVRAGMVGVVGYGCLIVPGES